LVVSCETAREINETMIQAMLRDRSMEFFKYSLATLTGGSGAVAVLVTDGSFESPPRRRLLGGSTQAAPQYHNLCRWGLDHVRLAARNLLAVDSAALLRQVQEVTSDSVAFVK